MGKVDMGTPPIVLRWIFCKVDPPIQELYSTKIRTTLFYEINAQCSHRAMKTWWRVPPSCIVMPRDEHVWWFIYSTTGFRLMSSWKSSQNVVQGHFVTFGLGAKNQMEQHNCMSLAPICVYGKFRYGNTTNSRMVYFFAELTHQYKSCIQGKWAKP